MDTRRAICVCSGVLVMVLAACGDDGVHEELPPDAPLSDAPSSMMASGMVGDEGGTIGEPGGPQIVVPPGALDTDTMITATATSEAAPSGAVSPVYRFEPEGVVFAVPITVRLPVSADVTTASMYWTKLGSETEFERIGGRVVAGAVEAEVVHFSGGYAGPNTGTRTLTGSAITSWGRTSGIINEPIDFTTTPVVALVADGSGGWTTITGTGTAAGTFSISGLPEGSVTLNIDNRYFVTAADAFDAGVVRAGRPGLVPSTSAQLNLNITNLEPWEEGDGIEILAPDADTWWFEEQQHLTIAPGATTLTGVVSNQHALDCCGTANLIRGDLGDALFVGQLSARQTADATPVPYHALTRVLTPAPFTQTQGGTNDITGTFSDVATASTFTVSIDQPAYAQIVGYTPAAGYPTKLGPNAGAARVNFSIGTYVDVQGVPGPDYLGMYTGSIDYALIHLPVDAPSTVATNLGYGQLPGWTTSLLARSLWGVRYWLPGTTFARGFQIGTSHTNLLPATGSQAVAPLLGPVENPTINGTSLFVQQADVPVTPHLAWQAPTVGTPTFYQVRFQRLHPSADGVSTQATLAAELYTTDTQLDVPPGALTAGPYAVLITASTGNPQTPTRFQYGTDSATVASAIIYIAGSAPQDNFYVFTKLEPDFGLDLDGDTTRDNQLAEALRWITPDLIGATASAVAHGDVLLLANVLTSSLVDADAARFTTYLGANPSPPPCVDASDTTCAQHLDGSGVFELDPNGADLTPLVGTIANGLLTAGPGELAIQLAMVPDRPLTLQLSSARVEYISPTANGFIARIGGAVSLEQLDSVIFPELEFLIDRFVAQDCVDPASPPDCGCVDPSYGKGYLGLFDTNQDCSVDLAEIQSNAAFMSMLAPDLMIDGVPYLSYGADVEAIAGSLAP